MKTLFTAICMLVFFASFTQTPSKNWHLLDAKDDGYYGISLEKAYKELLKDKTPKKKVIIADGIILSQEDLVGKIWKNEKEIPDNGIDDDKNGYIDDINGWNFSGMGTDTYEYVREFVRLRGKYENQNAPVKNNNKEYAYWKQIEATKNSKYITKDVLLKLVDSLTALQNYWQPKLKTDVINCESLKGLFPGDDANEMVKKMHQVFLNEMCADGFSINQEILNYTATINASPKIVASSKLLDSNDPYYFRKINVPGDDPYANNNRYYGTPHIDMSGTTNVHGTVCSSIVAANRNNQIGMHGIADSVKIMPIRASLAGGDEYDKDVANAIRYAVDNGAKIINMSFGKHFSPHKQWVDDAIRYAEKKGVLLIHGAGNDGTNNDRSLFYPMAKLENGKSVSNFINVGASSFSEDLVWNHSNYGKQTVDVFAPGHDIYVAYDSNKYTSTSGTSLAAPMVSGIAALIWSYYPKLTYKQVKHCIEQTIKPIETLVIKPHSKDEKVPFSSLSKTGGIVNAYLAIQEAEKMSKK